MEKGKARDLTREVRREFEENLKNSNVMEATATLVNRLLMEVISRTTKPEDWKGGKRVMVEITIPPNVTEFLEETSTFLNCNQAGLESEILEAIIVKGIYTSLAIYRKQCPAKD